MGSICNGNEKEQASQTVQSLNKNFSICQFSLRSACNVELILGSYRYHRAHTLLALVTADQADNCMELKDYASNYASSLHSIALNRKSLSFVSVARNAPYRKLAVGVLPLYRSNEAESYNQLFINIIKEVCSSTDDLSLQLYHTTESNNHLPNQTLVSLMIGQIIDSCTSIKVSVLSSEAKLLNLFRFQIMKKEDYEIKRMIQREDKY